MTERVADRPLTATFSKRRDPGVIGGRSISQVGVLIAGMFAGIGALNTAGGVRWGLFALMVLLVWMGFQLVFSRPVAAYFPALIGEGMARAFSLREYRGGPYREAQQTPTVPVLPGNLSKMEFHSYVVDGGGGEVGVIRDGARGTVMVGLEIEGDTFPMLAVPGQNARARGFGAMLDGLCDASSPVVGVQVLCRVIPDSGDELWREWRTRGSRGTTATARMYAEQLRNVSLSGARPESYLILAIDPRKDKARVRQFGGGIDGEAALAFSLLGQVQSDLTGAEVRVKGWLPPRGFAALVRTAFDPGAAVMVDRRGGGSGDMAGGDAGLQSGVAPAACIPVRARAARSYYAHNDRFSRTWWITEWPRSQAGVPVGFLQPLLLQVNHRHTVSLIFSPLPYKRAQRTIDVQLAKSDAKAQTNRKLGRRRRRSDEREEIDIDRREIELTEGFSNWRMAGLVSTTTRTLDELEVASADVQSAMNTCNLESQVWFVEQDQAFFAAALPFCRGLGI